MARRPGSVHEAAATGFSRSADAYERARPEYPDDAVAWLGRRLALGRGRRVLDLAAGTGKLTRPLVATGADVVAVEPVAEMRARIGPPARVLEGTAESIPLGDGAVDAVTVAQAFHWFDGPAALAEIHRVLRPGEALALVWNRRPLRDPVHEQVERLIGPYRRATPAYATGAWRAAFEATTLFGALEERTFEHARMLDAEALADRFGSVSFIAGLEPAPRAGVLGALRALAADGPVRVPYVCEVFACDRRP